MRARKVSGKFLINLADPLKNVEPQKRLKRSQTKAHKISKESQKRPKRDANGLKIQTLTSRIDRKTTTTTTTTTRPDPNMTVETGLMNVIDINEKLSAFASQSNDTFSTQALKELASSVVKVLMHLDGRHGVCREYCEPGKVVIRAKTESYLLLDLGHVVRMYFGDDYFDLHLDIHTPYQRSEHLSDLVAEVIIENDRNEKLRHSSGSF